MSFGGQGARREAGSEGYAEKYRAVFDEGYLKDEPVGQRWGKVEPAGSSGGTEGSDAINASETRSSALEVVGRLGSTGGEAKVTPPEAWRPSGSGKPAGEEYPYGEDRGMDVGSGMAEAGFRPRAWRLVVFQFPGRS